MKKIRNILAVMSAAAVIASVGALDFTVAECAEVTDSYEFSEQAPKSNNEAYSFQNYYGETRVSADGKRAFIVVEYDESENDGYNEITDTDSYTVNSLETFEWYKVYDISLHGNEDIKIDLSYIDYDTGEVVTYWGPNIYISLNYISLGDGTFANLPTGSEAVINAGEKGEKVFTAGNKAVIINKTGLNFWFDDVSDPLTAPEFVSETYGDACNGLPGGVGYTSLIYSFDKDGEYIVKLQEDGYIERLSTKWYYFSVENGVVTFTDYYEKESIPDGDMYGDINSDETVDIADVVAINLYLISEDYILSDSAIANADCVRDNTIDDKDSATLLGYIAEIIPYESLGE